MQLVNTLSHPLGSEAALQNFTMVTLWLAVSRVSLWSLFSWFDLFHRIAGVWFCPLPVDFSFGSRHRDSKVHLVHVQ